MKASVTNSLTSGPHAEIDEISYHGVVAAENWGARAPRALFRRLAKTNFGSNRVAHPFGVHGHVRALKAATCRRTPKIRSIRVHPWQKPHAYSAAGFDFVAARFRLRGRF